MPSDSRRSLSKPAKRRGTRSKASTTGNMANPRTEPPDDGNAARDARKYAVKNGHVITVPGRARAVIHKLLPESVPGRHSAPVGVAHDAGESGEECASAPIEGTRTLTTAAPV